MRARRRSKQVDKGKELEKQVAKMLDEAGKRYEWEDTLRHGGRKKGGVDFVTPYSKIECKHFTKQLTYKVNSEDHDIKWSQICILNQHAINGLMAGLIVREETDNRMIWLPVKSLLKHYISTGKKSINLSEIEELGRVIENLNWIR